MTTSWAARWLKPVLWRYFRPQVRGLEQVPAGPALLVANHNAALLMPDLFILGIALYERFGLDGLPYGLGHRTGVSLPVLRGVFRPLGTVPGCQESGRRLLARGEKVLACPGGELDSMRPFRKRHRVIFGAHRGYIRLALRTGVPIVPVVSAGAHETLIVLDDGQWLARLLRLDRALSLKTWPLVLCLPWGLWLGVPPPHLPLRTRIRIEVLEPIRFERQGAEAADDSQWVEACHRRVHGAMEAALARLAARE